MTLPLRTRFSAHLVSALSATPLRVMHALFVVAWIALPLDAAIEEDVPGLLILLWSPLVVWLMVYFAAKAEVQALPELHADAIARRDSATAQRAMLLLRLLATSGRRRALQGALGIELAAAGDHEAAIPALERTYRVGSTEREDTDRAYWLAVAYRATGREDDARATLRVAAESDGPFADEARTMLERATPFRG